MEDFRETCITHINNDIRVGISSSERSVITFIKKMKEQYPDDVVINHVNADGSICADFIGDQWNFLPRRKRQMNLTDEQRKEIGKRLQCNKGKNDSNSDD